jgi:hypothetical protein
MDFVILDKVLTTFSFITPFILYGGIIFVLSLNKSCGICNILSLKEYLLFKRFLDELHMRTHKNYAKPTDNLSHRINNHR